jgi:hypothetical protein
MGQRGFRLPTLNVQAGVAPLINFKPIVSMMAKLADTLKPRFVIA